MYAFGLVETNLFDECEKHALLGLERNPRDGWATHALAHFYEMTDGYEQGISFLDKTVENWEVIKLLKALTYWRQNYGQWTMVCMILPSMIGYRVVTTLPVIRIGTGQCTTLKEMRQRKHWRFLRIKYARRPLELGPCWITLMHPRSCTGFS